MGFLLGVALALIQFTGSGGGNTIGSGPRRSGVRAAVCHFSGRAARRFPWPFAIIHAEQLETGEQAVCLCSRRARAPAFHFSDRTKRRPLWQCAVIHAE